MDEMVDPSTPEPKAFASKTLPVLEEVADVHKVAVDRGGYRIVKRVEMREEHISESLRDERVDIERRRIGRVLLDDEVPAVRQEGDTLIVPVIEETLVTVKRLILREEVRITRIHGAHREQRNVTLRREEIEVERVAPSEHSEVRSLSNRRIGNESGSNASSRKHQEQEMSSVLVGMFETETAAMQARSELMSAGFSANAVTLTGGTENASATSAPSATTASAQPQHQNAITRFFSDLFGGDDARDDAERAGYADTYNEAFRRGSCGVSVTTVDDAEADRAERILNDCGAIDIDEKAQAWRQEGWTGGARETAVDIDDTAPAVSASSGATLQTGATQKLQEIEEELKVGKRAVVRGGVRIFSRMTEVPVSETVRLREEHADIRRTAVDRPATEADFAAFKEGSLEVREMGEEAVVGKSARVVGEVEISKTETERDETVNETVRRTEVQVEDIADAGSTSTRTSRTTGVADTSEPIDPTISDRRV